MTLNYTQNRQLFYHGFSGGQVWEVVAVTCVNQLANLLLIAVLSLIPALTDPHHNWIRYSIEFLIIIIPFTLCVTLLSNHILFVCFGLILLTFVSIVLCFAKRQFKPIVVKDLLNLRLNYVNRIPFLTNLFSTLLLCVCISILAVDFHVFDRRFAKTEIYGWSLMDVGVGSFIAANAGFSPESRLSTNPTLRTIDLFKKTVFATIPLIVLGLQRLIAVKSLQYPEHITEYGLHWNFFFTLAFTKLFSTTFCCLFSKRVNFGFCGLVLLVFYQICLSFGLSQFIQNDDRNGLFAANKEGIISLMGYISLYLIFVEIGRYCIRIRYIMKDWLEICLRMALLVVVFICLMNLSHSYVENISRREVNLSFVCWMIALNAIFIGLEFAIQSLVHCLQYLNVFSSGDSYKSILFSSIGYNGMLLFLVSNLLTGFVNFTFDTISVSDSFAFVIIITYGLVLCFISVFCFHRKIQLKIPVKRNKD